MDRRRFLLGAFAASIAGTVPASASAGLATPNPFRARLAEIERLGLEAYTLLNRPWRWKELPEHIHRYHVAIARIWLENRGLDAPARDDVCIYNTQVRSDEVSGIPWRETFLAIVEMEATAPASVDYDGSWYHQQWRIDLHQRQRKALLKAIHACERCAAAVRSEITTGHAAFPHG